jgi:hypothetical protein
VSQFELYGTGLATAVYVRRQTFPRACRFELRESLFHHHIPAALAVREKLNRSAARERVNYQNDNGSNHRHKHAVDVNAIDALRTEQGKQIAAYNRANNTIAWDSLLLDGWSAG